MAEQQMREAVADMVARSLYATFATDTLREMVAVGAALKETRPEKTQLADLLNDALKRMIKEREELSA